MSPRASSVAPAARAAVVAAALAVGLTAAGLAPGCDGSPLATAAPAIDAAAIGTGPGSDRGDGGDPDAGADAPPDDAAPTAVCPPPTSTDCVPPAPSFAATILPIFNQRCNTCHDLSIPDAPWPLDNYPDVSAWSAIIAGDLVDCAMPPVDGGVPFPDAERQQVLAWLACGAPDN